MPKAFGRPKNISENGVPPHSGDPSTPLRPDRREEVLSECAPLRMTPIQKGLLETAIGTDTSQAKRCDTIFHQIGLSTYEFFLTTEKKLRAELKRLTFGFENCIVEICGSSSTSGATPRGVCNGWRCSAAQHVFFLPTSSSTMAERETGTVKWFSNEKGYGFIVAEERDEDLFVHYSEIDADGFKSLEENDRVEFSVGHTDKGPNAQEVRVIG